MPFGLTRPRRVFDGHVFETQNVLVRQELKQLDFPKGRNGKLGRPLTFASPAMTDTLESASSPVCFFASPLARS